MAMEEEIRKIEEEISSTSYNKATEKHVSMLKAKLARLKEQSLVKHGTKQAVGFFVKKTGDATVLLVGMPSAGKSTLINAMTNAESKTAAYEFTTLDVIPGMLEYRNAFIQILDIPGIIEGASRGKGEGRKVMSAARVADLVIIMLDPARGLEGQHEMIAKELYSSGFRLDQQKPSIRLAKKTSGGVNISCDPSMDRKSIEAILKEFKIMSADIVIRGKLTSEQFIDFLMGNRIYVPSITVINKSDIAGKRPANGEKAGWIYISALKKQNLEALKEAIWSRLAFSRIYLKRIGLPADMRKPLIIKGSCAIEDVCKKIHADFARYFRYARVWGKSAKFGGQKVGLRHILQDGDVVELHSRK
ncbi:MAG: GTP-binding protein [Candidatus Aenigmarchaeota archaeon]|nr:GTP-binding protein [Candidatus Aenigmarchaeota archaeon]